ncbi:MAG: hypothetical protein ACRD2R_04625, partial [Terriglobales bacterium]
MKQFAELSIDQVRAQIRERLVERFGSESEIWSRDMYPDSAVFEIDGVLQRIPFEVSGAEVTIGEPEEVVQDYVPATEMRDFDNQWVEIFRAGNYGDKGEWPPAKIDEVVKNFQAGLWQPPAVVGHPEHDSPAMGWVKSLKRDGQLLLAQFGKVHPALETLVEAGSYPNRSAAFYLDPQGKGPVLRHVGFLGGMPPQVKGMAPIRFNDGDFVAIDFQEEEEQAMKPEEIKSTVRGELRAFFSNLFGGGGGGEARPKPFSEEQMNEIADQSAAKAIESASAKFNEELGKRDQKIAELET